MSSSAKVFVGLNQEAQTLDVLKAVKSALDKYSRAKFDEFLIDSKGIYLNRFQRGKILEETGKHFSNGVTVETHDFDSYMFNFGCGEEFERSVFCCTHIHSDYQEFFVGKKVIFSLGASGSIAEIIEVISKAIVEFGEVFYDLNDCDLIDFQKFNGHINPVK